MSLITPLHTLHLTLRAATAADVASELSGREAFATRLGVAVPESWPPGEYDEAAQRHFLARLTGAGPAGVGWYGWYAIRPADVHAPATVVAGGGYFGPPSPEGVVELGYSVCPEWRGRGYATELASALAAHAARQPGLTAVIAHCTTANPASIRVLERSGFVRSGAGEAPGTLRFVFAPRASA
jgi:[ribosomal protein S5]-alanine N-acetyltransferase